MSSGGRRTRFLWDNRGPMDPARKRRIRLVVALTAAVLLAGALVYTSFSAGSETRTPSQLIKSARSGISYQLTGKVVGGSIRQHGSGIAFRVRDRAGSASVPVSYTVRAGARGDRHRSPRGRDLRRRARLADDQVPVEVQGFEDLRWRR